MGIIGYMYWSPIWPDYDALPTIQKAGNGLILLRSAAGFQNNWSHLVAGTDLSTSLLLSTGNSFRSYRFSWYCNSLLGQPVLLRVCLHIAQLRDRCLYPSDSPETKVRKVLVSYRFGEILCKLMCCGLPFASVHSYWKWPSRMSRTWNWLCV